MAIGIDFQKVFVSSIMESDREVKQILAKRYIEKQRVKQEFEQAEKLDKLRRKLFKTAHTLQRSLGISETVDESLEDIMVAHSKILDVVKKILPVDYTTYSQEEQQKILEHTLGKTDFAELRDQIKVLEKKISKIRKKDDSLIEIDEIEKNVQNIKVLSETLSHDSLEKSKKIKFSAKLLGYISGASLNIACAGLRGPLQVLLGCATKIEDRKQHLKELNFSKPKEHLTQNKIKKSSTASNVQDAGQISGDIYESITNTAVDKSTDYMSEDMSFGNYGLFVTITIGIASRIASHFLNKKLVEIHEGAISRIQNPENLDELNQTIEAEEKRLKEKEEKRINQIIEQDRKKYEELERQKDLPPELAENIGYLEARNQSQSLTEETRKESLRKDRPTQTLEEILFKSIETARTLQEETHKLKVLYLNNKKRDTPEDSDSYSQGMETLITKITDSMQEDDIHRNNLQNFSSSLYSLSGKELIQYANEDLNNKLQILTKKAVESENRLYELSIESENIQLAEILRTPSLDSETKKNIERLIEINNQKLKIFCRENITVETLRNITYKQGKNIAPILKSLESERNDLTKKIQSSTNPKKLLFIQSSREMQKGLEESKRSLISINKKASNVIGYLSKEGSEQNAKRKSAQKKLEAAVALDKKLKNVSKAQLLLFSSVAVLTIIAAINPATAPVGIPLAISYIGTTLTTLTGISVSGKLSSLLLKKRAKGQLKDISKKRKLEAAVESMKLTDSYLESKKAKQEQEQKPESQPTTKKPATK